MTTQERINLLAEAALRAAPLTDSIPKPVTFMPSFERLRSQEFAYSGETPRPAAAPASAPEAPERDLHY